MKLLSCRQALRNIPEEQQFVVNIPMVLKFILVQCLICFTVITDFQSGPGCSKLTTSLVNVSLKFQTLISNIHQLFSLKKCEKLLCKSFCFCSGFCSAKASLIFFQLKYQCIWL